MQKCNFSNNACFGALKLIHSLKRLQPHGKICSCPYLRWFLGPFDPYNFFELHLFSPKTCQPMYVDYGFFWDYDIRRGTSGKRGYWSKLRKNQASKRIFHFKGDNRLLCRLYSIDIIDVSTALQCPIFQRRYQHLTSYCPLSSR